MSNMNLKKLWRRKSVSITECDPTYKVTYLGNVLTGWAKGDGCVEKPLATLWRNYCQSSRPDISMKVTICGAGLRAVTREHGLTEYWAHRVTHCSSHPSYPRVFCWVYRHEGRRLKQELRCHAVLCSKQGKAEVMSAQLKERLAAALHEFRREKAIRQNARLSLVHAVYDAAALPLRKVYLITGSANYRPPLERSKSAPKLGAIEEITEEEEEAMELEEISRRTAEQVQVTVDALIRLHEEAADPSDTNCGASITEGDDNTNEVERFSHEDRLGDVVEEEEEEEDEIEEEAEETLENRRRKERLWNMCRIELNYSSPNLFFHHHTSPEAEPPPQEVTKESVDLALLESFKDKLGLASNPEESLTSDQPESIGSHSCSSSCDGGTEEEINILEVGSECALEDKRSGCAKVVGKASVEEEDNISEESGYSEECK